MSTTADAHAPHTLADVVAQSARLSRDERRAIGRARRDAAPIEGHADVPSADTRPDPIALLCRQDERRVPELVPIRHGRMSATSFTFYRGAAAVMASDLAAVTSSGLTVQLCGDAHLSNFGLFNGPDRRLVFDLNDFDETHPGPFEWDLKRLAASMVVAARDNEMGDKKGRAAARAAVEGYRDVILKASMADPLRLHYFRIEMDDLIAQLRERGRRQGTELAKKASGKNSLKAFKKLTEVVDGRRRLIDAPPLIVRLDLFDDESRQEEIALFWAEYLSSLPLSRRRVIERYRPTDVASKVVGVGSVGTRCLMVLCETPDGEPLFIQFKEATQSVLEEHLGASEYANSGERVVAGQRLMQATGDVFLGWARHEGGPAGRPVDYYFRQLWDGKGSIDVATLRGRGLGVYGRLCGQALALAHARTGDAAVIDGYLGDGIDFDEAVIDFAATYADLTERDHAAHLAAIESGQIAVVRDL